MKKTKLTALLALCLAAILALSSCGATVSDIRVKDVINKDAVPEEPLPTLTSGNILVDLTEAEIEEIEGDLIYFVGDYEVGMNTYERHMIYDLEADRIIHTSTESATVEVDIEIGSFGEDDEEYFTVFTQTWNLDNDGDPNYVTNESTVLYDRTAAKIAEAPYNTEALDALDLIYFDGKCYRADETGAVAYAFDYSPLAAFPDIDESSEDYYYSFDTNVDEEGGRITVYNKTLEYVSSYTVPSYAIPTSFAVLEGGDLLLQYAYEEDALAEDYTFIGEQDIVIESLSSGDSSYSFEAGKKFTLVTELISPKNGKAKEIDCDYVIAMIETMNDNDRETIGVEDIFNAAMGFVIENKRVNPNDSALRLLTFDKNGKASEFEFINGESVMTFEIVAPSRWRVTTQNRTYLVNEKGEILGDITEAVIIGNFVIDQTKVYNMDLEPIYEYASRGMEGQGITNRGLIFESLSGETYFYSGEGEPVRLIQRESDLDLEIITDNYFVICDYADEEDIDYDFYNDKGEKFFTLDFNAFIGDSDNIEFVTSTDSACLISAFNAQGETVYYRLK